jgi:hypothetical protein
VVRFFKNAATSKLFSEISGLTFYPKNRSYHESKGIITGNSTFLT